MKHIVVIGGGTMGNGIAHTAAASGLDVTLVDVGQEILDRAIKTISTNLQRGVDKGKMTAGDKTAVLGRIKASSDRHLLPAARGEGFHAGMTLEPNAVLIRTTHALSDVQRL